MAHSRALRALRWGLAALAVLTATAAVWWLSPGEKFEAWRQGPPVRLWAAIQRQEDLWREEGTRRRAEKLYAPLSRISVDLQLAALVNEDIDFFGHGPIDIEAVWEALREGRRPGARLRGASTISQQLARTLFLSGERTLVRKLKEARLAWWLERRLGKRRILELYLNVVEFGPGIFGAETAALHYYGVPASALDAEKAAGLVAAIPSPGRDNPSTASHRWQARCATIVHRMERAGWLRGRLASLSAEPD
jgi:monofunctional biosynthetic peptidoglycan transglycosylase